VNKGESHSGCRFVEYFLWFSFQGAAAPRQLCVSITPQRIELVIRMSGKYENTTKTAKKRATTGESNKEKDTKMGFPPIL
jgi:hypothetical protein